MKNFLPVTCKTRARRSTWTAGCTASIAANNNHSHLNLLKPFGSPKVNI